jgi:hypothetical protein
MLSCAQRVLEIAELFMRWESLEEEETEDEMVKLLIGIQRV